MQRAKGRIVGTAAAAALVLVVVVVFSLTGAQPVATVTVEKRDVVELYVATGQLQARHTSDIGPEVGGIVDTLKVDAGDTVTRGNVLAELRPRDAKLAIDKAAARVRTLEKEYRQAKSGPTEAELDAARARLEGAESNLAQAKRELERARALHEKDMLTDAKLEQARTAVEQAASQRDRARADLNRLRQLPRPERVAVAKARLEQARVELQEAENTLEKTTLRAPFDGLVLGVQADPGERATPGQTVVRVANVDTIEVYAEIDEDYFGRLEKGQRATLVFPSMPKQTFSATLRQIGPEVDSNRGIIGVHLDPENLPDKAFPGLTVDVNIEVAHLQDATAVPQTSVAEKERRAYVLRIEDAHAIAVPVRILARGETWTAITAAGDRSIQAGDVLLRNAAKVEPGTAVTPKERS